jgi:AAA family ATP:ADP antiporter
VSGLASRLLNFKKGELPLAVLSALFYFCVLCGYFFLRPVREAMGVSRGMDDLRWLFVGTSLVSLAVVLLFGGVVSQLDRRKFIPIGYLFVIVCLFIFAGLLVADAFAGGGLIGTDAGTTTSLVTGYTFYMWLSTINLFVNSLFWAFMVDVFNVDQGKRMFAFIGIGGTLGALAGGWATNQISGMTESVFLPPGLMMIGAAFFGLSILIMLRLDSVALASEHSQLTADSTRGAAQQGREKIGGKAWDGITEIIRSPYLLGIAAYIVLMAISNTLIYFTQAAVISEATDTFSQRVESFALFDMATQLATLITQVFITTHLIKRLGVGLTLTIMPLITVAGLPLSWRRHCRCSDRRQPACGRPRHRRPGWRNSAAGSSLGVVVHRTRARPAAQGRGSDVRRSPDELISLLSGHDNPEIQHEILLLLCCDRAVCLQQRNEHTGACGR